MDQVFYREPLNKNSIKFEVKEKRNDIHVFSHGSDASIKKDVHVFSHGNDMSKRKYDGGIIPVYYPEFDNIVIDFGDEVDKTMVRKREK